MYIYVNNQSPSHWRYVWQFVGKKPRFKMYVYLQLWCPWGRELTVEDNCNLLPNIDVPRVEFLNSTGVSKINRTLTRQGTWGQSSIVTNPWIEEVKHYNHQLGHRKFSLVSGKWNWGSCNPWMVYLDVATFIFKMMAWIYYHNWLSWIPLLFS